ncbi:Cyclopropane-fatty-acyl-phospholipid synthase [Gossypium australe]|uniref:Cyclopropane-fatty-acyl-phospholipid synthase n=1 Tax=Gossypium australe TaxID=47621 RepID=A0A5B6WHA8_9ROSI|nr:Cyclopropane-fatty-acyl-phospholipid synthase [Gossypium australe]
MAQFNLSLLAKQGWRLLTLPDSLVARVLKAKYFPENSWEIRAPIFGVGVLEKGLVWKVGTGANISICYDNWIPGYGSGRLLSRFVNLHCDKVVELISVNVREWNKDMIVNTFPEDVADLILRKPLAMEPYEDFLAWSGEPSSFGVPINYYRTGILQLMLYILTMRDSRGNIITSSAVIHRGVQNAFEAEALACRRATQVALDMEQEGGIIEGDSLSVIKKCQNPERDKS